MSLPADGPREPTSPGPASHGSAVTVRGLVKRYGRVVAHGSPAELTTTGDSQELRFRARAGMDVTELAAALPTGYQAAEPAAGRYVVQGRIDPPVLSAVTSWCAAQGALADDVRITRRSLEDVFLDLTGRELRS